MTATAVPARPGQDARRRPVPWRRMAWVTWRQHRVALAGVIAPLAAVAVYLGLAGSSMHHAYAAAAGCRPASSYACADALGQFRNAYGPTAQAIAILLLTAPALAGAFTGAPVLARELETGTFRFAWTQGFGRVRWTLGTLVPVAVVVAVAAGAFSLLFSWYYQPFFADGQKTPFAPEVFDLRGVAFAAWTLAAFAIGALAGLLIRRVVPAIAATLALYSGLALAVGLHLRQDYATPVLTREPNLSGSAWVMSQWWTKGGRFAFAGRPPNSLLMQDCPAAGPYKQSPDAITRCLVDHGYTQWTSYQPGSRYWSFQWIEGGWLLALSVLLVAVTVFLVRRRAA